jgi:hypothetical protein
MAEAAGEPGRPPGVRAGLAVDRPGEAGRSGSARGIRRGHRDAVGLRPLGGSAADQAGSRVDGQALRQAGALIHSHAGERRAAQVGHVLGVAGRADLRTHRDPVAVLSHDARPELTTAAEPLEHLLQVRRVAVRVTGQGDIAVAVGALNAPKPCPP